MSEHRMMPIPDVYPEHQLFWEGTRRGKLHIKKCQSCGEHHYYPRDLCPFCNSEETFWVEATGIGTIYTYSVMRKGHSYAIAFVTLVEGVRIMTNIVDCDLDRIAIGQKVKVVFKHTGDGNEENPLVPCFTPMTN
ncbi:OB-fold domain-containing protein [Cytobacillus kochii]|uniref:Zn-ribbon domain-containing OB-fold protein n=1 Tax=Cytobacillus kochii TaxID=859143 RepID=UPI002E1BA6F5|nr:OB-fold domain-containing protein [Cytobacillus kochii]